MKIVVLIAFLLSLPSVLTTFFRLFIVHITYKIGTEFV
jgi:hypothetical protein